MHIPDGYLSPVTCGVAYATVIPFWGVAVARVRRTIGGRTVPLLAIFSAFSFAVMMFNIPVPGGTTAHGVAGTLAAIVIGPWAAVISTSVALIIQALFFGDGGITAIGANSLNIGVILPMSGFLVYRLLSSGSQVLSQRRIVAAAVASYAGITLAALAVGLELGIQPHLWSTNGVPDYSPYGFSMAIPTMLVSHIFGASFVEAAITGLGIAYLQKSYPEILFRRERRAPGAEAPARAFNPWIPAAALVAVSVVVVFVVGLVQGHGSLGTWGGLAWSTVDRRSVLQTMLVSAAASAVALPAAWFALRRRPVWRPLALLFVGLVIWAPLGLIAPGGAFAEDTPATQAQVDAALRARAAGDASLFEALPDVNRQCECVPGHIADVSYAQHAILSGYRPPWVSDTDPAWQQNVGYQVAGFAGIALLSVIGLAAYRVGRSLLPGAPPDWRNAP